MRKKLTHFQQKLRFFLYRTTLTESGEKLTSLKPKGCYEEYDNGGNLIVVMLI